MSKPWYLPFLVAVALIVSGCSAASKLQRSKGNKYQYKYVMIAPVESEKLAFKDDQISIMFRFEDSAIRYQLWNLSPTDLYVDLSKASIGVKGRFYSVLSPRLLHVKTIETVPMPTVLPGGYVVDIAIPAENVVHDGQRWVEQDLLPTTDNNSPQRRKAIQDNVGSVVDFVLPIRFGEEVRKYSFRFMVKSVSQISWERYRPPRRSLPLPPITVFKSENYVVTAILVTGFLGFSAYVLTQKKCPPSE